MWLVKYWVVSNNPFTTVHYWQIKFRIIFAASGCPPDLFHRTRRGIEVIAVWGEIHSHITDVVHHNFHISQTCQNKSFLSLLLWLCRRLWISLDWFCLCCTFSIMHLCTMGNINQYARCHIPTLLFLNFVFIVLRCSLMHTIPGLNTVDN